MSFIQLEATAPGCRYLTQMGSVLSHEEVAVEDRLQIAGALFWRSVNFADFWPDDFDPQIRSLLDRLLQHGGIRKTASKLSPRDAESLCHDLTSFACDFVVWMSGESNFASQQ